MPPDSHLDPIVRQFVEHAGNLTQSSGLGRVIGQLYAFLYFSHVPRNLSNMQNALGISKGSASTAVRQLEQWGAVRKVWVKGDRRDYYEADEWLGNILKNAVLDTLGKRLNSYTSLLQNIESQLAAVQGNDEDTSFLKERIQKLRNFHDKAEAIWDSPALKLIMK